MALAAVGASSGCGSRGYRRADRSGKRYGGAPVVSDAHLAGVVKEELRSRGVERVVITAWNTKALTDAFRGIRARVLADSISLPDDPELVAELLRMRTSMRSGQPSVELPRSVQSHCDMASALAAACLQLERKGALRRSRTWSSFRAGGAGSISEREREELLVRYSQPIDVMEALRW